MESENEKKLRIENETLNLKREYKYALENLARVKSDTSDILTIKDKSSAEINERNRELQRILDEIASAKLSWLQEQSKGMDELDKKNSEANNVLKRKAELNRQEEDIRKIEASSLEARNEARTLEFKIEQEKTAIEVRENQIKNRENEIKRREEKLSKDIDNFKEQVVKSLEKVNSITI